MISFLAAVSLAFAAHGGPPSAAAVIAPNDNRRPAGSIKDGTLTVRLEAREGTWFPEGSSGRSVDVAAWAEEGKPLQNPGPLLRVPLGTEIRANLRNTLARRLTVFGFGVHGRTDSLVLEPGAEREVRFTPPTAGSFYYMARGEPGPFFGIRRPEDTQLNGAIIVDAQSKPASRRYDERVFLISWWFTFDSTSKTGLGRATMAMNGLAWPHTERIDLTQGDSVRWHVMNFTESDHPMHLHGFYFRMEAKGDGVRDTLYVSDRQRLAVTEVLLPQQTMTLSWAPTRPGNWIYHCHFAGHVSHLASLDTDRGVLDEHALAGHASDRPHQMYGLVLGIRVAPRGPVSYAAKPSRPMRLEVRERPNVYGDRPGYAFVLGGTPEASNPDAMPLPGPTLVLQRNEPVAITIVNHAKDRAAVHWHGIELDSYPDGVPDWSGMGKDILPSIRPGDSLTVRFTPPRAGTFMYHSHFNEDAQINSGLYGAIVVLEPGQRFDPAVDRIMMFTSAGPTTNVINGPFTPLMLNGSQQPEPIELRPHTKYRLRMINITGDVNTVVTLLENGKPTLWRAVAKDGATLPASQATMRPSALFFDPGEIYDFELTTKSAGEMTLTFGPPPVPPEFGWPKTVTVPVRVR
jgi:manganese oxidase